MDSHKVSYIIKIIFSLIAVVITAFLLYLTLRKPQTLNKILSSPDRSDYTYYLDGNEVELKTIDPSLYSHTYDDNNKIVYLSTKGSNYTTIWLPIIK